MGIYYKFLFMSILFLNIGLLMGQFQYNGFIEDSEANIKQGDPPTVLKSDNPESLPIATKDLGDFNVEGGAVKLDYGTKDKEGYTGTINVKNGIIKTDVFYESKKEDFTKEFEYKINDGRLIVDNGRIISFEGKAEKFVIPYEDVNREGEGVKINGDITYENDKGVHKIHSKELEFSKEADFKFALDGEVKLRSKDEFSLEIESLETGKKDIHGNPKFETKYTVDSKGGIIDVDFNGANAYGKKQEVKSKIIGKFDSKNNFGRIDINLEPSEGQKSAQFHFSKGVTGRITERTNINDFGEYSEEHENLINFGNNNLEISTSNNQVSLVVEKDKFDSIINEKITDNSQVLISYGGKERVVFNKGLPRVTGDISSSDTLLATQFENFGQTYSWELIEGSNSPAIDKHNMLFLVSEDFSSKAESLLSLPFKTYDKNLGNKIDFLKELPSHKITNIDKREFNDLESFVNSLTRDSQGGKYDEVFLLSHGFPTRLSNSINWRKNYC